jgi:hypothetical protein
VLVGPLQKEKEGRSATNTHFTHFFKTINTPPADGHYDENYFCCEIFLFYAVLYFLHNLIIN